MSIAKVEVNFDRCFQLMECNDLRLLQQWVLQWQDLGVEYSSSCWVKTDLGGDRSQV